jgi:hypothetical protein
MNKLPVSRPLPVAVALAALMLATRSHHFATPMHLPDASWAVFFLAGALLPGWRPLAALLGLAALVDYVSITFGGVSAYCVSPAYVALIPAYGALYAAGHWYARDHRAALSTLPRFGAAALVGATLCELLSSGAFYVFSGRFADLALAEFGARFVRYFPQALSGIALYLGAAAIAYGVFAALPRRHGVASPR